MGFLSKIIKAGAAKKAFDIVKREAGKPENQRKAKEMLARFQDKRKGRPGGDKH